MKGGLPQKGWKVFQRGGMGQKTGVSSTIYNDILDGRNPGGCTWAKGVTGMCEP